jgi:glycosyltransferase involved in cell wall biosynthesis
MRGGLPDHTDRLAHALSASHRVTVLTSRGVATERPFAVKAEVLNWHDREALLDRVRAASGSGPVLWQYVPHMYGRGGVNFAVPGAMAQLAREGRRQVVLAHEIRAPFSLWPHRSFYALAHRLMWRRVRAAAQAVGISTSAWLERERGRQSDWVNGARVGRSPTWFLAPSPSNIPVVRVQSGHRQAWREEQGLGAESRCVGFFGSVGSGKQFEWVLAGWREARRRVPSTGLVVLGGRPEPRLTEEERGWFRALGFLPGEDVSRALQALDLLVLPFEDGVSERRSSFMVGLAHGLTVVTTLGEGTGKDLAGEDFYWGVPLNGGATAYATAVREAVTEDGRRRAMGERAARRYAERYDWGCLVTEMQQHWSAPGLG